MDDEQRGPVVPGHPARGGRPRDPRHRLGEHAEALVAGELVRRGYEIIGRNVRVGRKELDIIARRGRVIVVCEVRARTSSTGPHPLETITPTKVRHLREGAAAWLRTQDARGLYVRFDAAAVTFDDPDGRIEYLEDAF